jgi:hypothetical protein
MSNHTGTLFRIIFIFLSLIGFWFVLSLAFTIVLILFTNIQFNIATILSVFGFLLFVRVFYPRFIFKN